MQMLAGYFGVLQYTRNIEIFTQLLTFLAITSIVVWAIVILSTFARFCIRLLLRRKKRKKAERDIYVSAIK